MTSNKYVKKMVHLIIILSVIILLRFVNVKDQCDTPSHEILDLFNECSSNRDEQKTFFSSRECGPRKLGSLLDSNGEINGYYLETMGFCSHIHGYAGPIELALLFDGDKKLKKIHITDHTETPAFLKRLERKGFYEQFIGQTIKELLGNDYETVTRATLSSQAIIQSMKTRLEMLEKENSDSQSTTDISFSFSWVHWLTLAYMAFLTYAYIKPTRFVKYRIYFLICTVSLMGFINGYFISFALIKGWIINGIPISKTPLLIAIFLLTFGFSILSGRNIYCSCICPFGALQELTRRLNRKNKYPLPNFLKKNRNIIRKTYFAFTSLMLFSIIPIDIAYFEPFSAFLFLSASMTTLILAVLSLVLSLFYPRFWCGFLCPTGSLIDFTKG